MKINGKNYLLCEKRGCNFFKGDPITKRSDMENYRVYIEVECSDRTIILGDLMRANIYDYSKKTPRLVYDCVLGINLQRDMYGFRPHVDAREYEYTKADVLKYVNKVTGNSFEEIKWVHWFEARVPKGANFTPAKLIQEWADKNHLTTFQLYGETVVELYTGQYKYLCYKVCPDKGFDCVKVALEAI